MHCSCCCGLWSVEYVQTLCTLQSNSNKPEITIYDIRNVPSRLTCFLPQQRDSKWRYTSRDDIVGFINSKVTSHSRNSKMHTWNNGISRLSSPLLIDRRYHMCTVTQVHSFISYLCQTTAASSFCSTHHGWFGKPSHKFICVEWHILQCRKKVWRCFCAFGAFCLLRWAFGLF